MATPFNSPARYGPDGLNERPSIENVGGENVSPPDEYVKYFPIWRTIRDLYDGEWTVKSKGEKYLKKLRSHTPTEYDSYLYRTPFYNAIKRTHDGLVASLFRRDPEYTIPPQLASNTPFSDLTLPITNTGKTTPESIRFVAQELLLTGRAGILVDMPEGVSIDAEPYFALYTAENIFCWRPQLIKGKRIIDRIILTEFYDNQTQYASVRKKRIRVLRLDPSETGMVYSQDIFDYDNDGNQLRPRHVVPKVRGAPLDYIPFIFLNPSCLGCDVEPPPLTDLTALNLSHYESSALLSHALFYAGMPTYVIAGEDNNDPISNLGNQEMAVGPSAIWRLNQGDKAEILEFTGHGLTFLENAVQDKQSQMQSLGGRLITANRKTPSLTQEAYNLMEASDKATLLDVAQQTERAFHLAMTYWAEMSGKTLAKNLPSMVELNKEFDSMELTAREMRAIQALYERRLIPKDVLYYTLRQIGVIPMEYSLEEFSELLTKPDQLYEDPDLVLKQKEIEEKAKQDALAAKQNKNNVQENTNVPSSSPVTK